MSGFFMTIDDYRHSVEPNEAQARTIERFAREIESRDLEWEVFSVDVTGFLGDDVCVVIRTRNDGSASHGRSYMFEVGARGGAHRITRGGNRRYLKPSMCEETRIY